MSIRLFDEAATTEGQMTARQVKDALRIRHPGSGGQMPGAWTVIEEWRNIDVLAFSAWQSEQKYGRVGYEVKVSRGDLRSELLNPHKRAANVEWCNAFFLAVPAGLLTDDEIAFVEPEWTDQDWTGEPCPGFGGRQCRAFYRRRRYVVTLPRPSTYLYDTETIACPTCNGKGRLGASRVERESPTCWVPSDLGLVVVDGRGTRIVKPAPRRKEVPPLGAHELGKLVRWISMRPDPRHTSSLQAVSSTDEATKEGAQ